MPFLPLPAVWGVRVLPAQFASGFPMWVTLFSIYHLVWLPDQQILVLWVHLDAWCWVLVRNGQQWLLPPMWLTLSKVKQIWTSIVYASEQPHRPPGGQLHGDGSSTFLTVTKDIIRKQQSLWVSPVIFHLLLLVQHSWPFKFKVTWLGLAHWPFDWWNIQWQNIKGQILPTDNSSGKSINYPNL